MGGLPGRIGPHVAIHCSCTLIGVCEGQTDREERFDTPPPSPSVPVGWVRGKQSTFNREHLNDHHDERPHPA